MLRQIIGLSLFALLLISSSDSYAQDVKISESVALPGDGRVLIDTYKGSIDVTTWDRDEVSINVLIEADGDQDLVELTEVHIDKSGKSLRIETDYKKAKKARKKGLFGNYSVSLPLVHYTIRMPRTADLSIEDYKSEIKIADIDADLDLETYKGEAYVDRVEGELRIDTYKGEVFVSELRGALHAETYKGEIEAHFLDFAGSSMVDTYRGEVNLVFPRETGFDLNADLGRRGDIDANFSLTALKQDKNSYRGEVMGGGPRLKVETYSGTINLKAMQ